MVAIARRHTKANAGRLSDAGAILVARYGPGPRNRIRKCGRCRKFEAAPPIATMQPLTCSGPGELLHVDFTLLRRPSPERGAGHT